MYLFSPTRLRVGGVAYGMDLLSMSCVKNRPKFAWYAFVWI